MHRQAAQLNSTESQLNNTFPCTTVARAMDSHQKQPQWKSQYQLKLARASLISFEECLFARNLRIKTSQQARDTKALWNQLAEPMNSKVLHLIHMSKWSLPATTMCCHGLKNQQHPGKK